MFNPHTNFIYYQYQNHDTPAQLAQHTLSRSQHSSAGRSTNSTLTGPGLPRLVNQRL